MHVTLAVHEFTPLVWKYVKYFETSEKVNEQWQSPLISLAVLYIVIQKVLSLQ